MSHMNTEALVNRAFENATPDLMSQIMKELKKGKGQIIEVDMRPRISVVRRAALIAAAVMIVFSAVFGFLMYRFTRVFSAISIESSASVVIEYNKEGRAVRLSSLNSKGEKIEKAVNVFGKSVEEAVELVYDAFKDRGFLDENNNALLITSDCEDEEREEELRTDAFSLLKRYISADHIAVISQTNRDEKEDTRNAEHFRISIGKAQLIAQIVSSDRHTSLKALSKLTVDELMHIANSMDLAFEGIEQEGEPMILSLLSEEDAVRLVMRDENLSGVSIEKTVTRLSADDTGLVYLIQSKAGKTTFTYRVSAYTGEIVYIAKSMGDQTQVIYEKPPQKNTAPADDNSGYSYQNSDISSASGSTQNSSQPQRDTEGARSQSGTEASASHRTTPEKETQAPAQRATEGSSRETQPQSASEAEPEIFTSRTPLIVDIEDKKAPIEGDLSYPADHQNLEPQKIYEGLNTYFTPDTYPYDDDSYERSFSGKAALVCSREQFYSLFRTYSDQKRGEYTAGYFEKKALLVILTETMYNNTIEMVNTAAPLKNGEMEVVITDRQTGVSAVGEDVYSVGVTIFELDRSDARYVTSLICRRYDAE